ncbi:MAG: hypothetical protein J6R91_00795 [Bacteroidaceae bacterium]|nr:hypothetical protein [Bacteroidaceae bacterium]
MRTLYITLTIFAALFALLSEELILPTNYILDTPETTYTLSLVSVSFTFCCLFLALRLFKFKKVKKDLERAETEQEFAAYRKWNAIRIALAFTPVFINLFIYYGVNYDSSAMYCLLISIIGTLFCWPSQKP